MNIKNMLCAIFMMSAAFGHSVAIAGGIPFETVRSAGKAGMALAIISVGALTGAMSAGAIALGTAYCTKMIPEEAIMAVTVAGGIVGLEKSCALVDALLVENWQNSYQRMIQNKKEASKKY